MTADIQALLGAGPVTFVVASIGLPLRWIAEAEKFRFWKMEAKPHVVDHVEGFRLEDFPDEAAYVASEWASDSGEVIIVFQVSH